MEPGYLGDVLIRMNATFAEAEAAKPAILFVDEMDGINMRGSSGEWTTYWDQIVNRLLELQFEELEADAGEHGRNKRALWLSCQINKLTEIVPG